MQGNIFINKNLIIAENHFKTAKLIKIPFTNGFCFWQNNKFFHQSEYEKYISIFIDKNRKYQSFKYKNFKKVEEKVFLGKEIINFLESAKFKNSLTFINKKSKSKYEKENKIIVKSKQQVADEKSSYVKRRNWKDFNGIWRAINKTGTCNYEK